MNKPANARRPRASRLADNRELDNRPLDDRSNGGLSKAQRSNASPPNGGLANASRSKAGPSKAGRSKAGPTQRQLRVAEEIRHVLSGIFGRNEFRDPELAGARITVTEVRIGPDLKRATAFIARLGRSDIDRLIPSLIRATPYLRGQVAKALRLRIAPDLTFTPDLALDYAMKIDELMHRPEIARDLQKADLKQDIAQGD